MTINILFESLHVIEFAFLYLLLVGALRVNKKFTKATSYAVAAVAMLYGLVDEVHQLYVVGRSFTLIDLLKNCIGVVLACMMVHIYYFGQEASRFRARPD
ncbi:VanZ family protein [Halobacillus naozhouensis]|uniref:VanZ family protein n=1 Tax=Halobacillus naozhouensis TaxID=554880 RepID=A0ABY8IX26_9BACI|nr:VanZ family protein [Halobacillus naozhouensis]WFT74311.1 VanZ family protein [Halobacillus naozhouensis]